MGWRCCDRRAGGERSCHRSFCGDTVLSRRAECAVDCRMCPSAEPEAPRVEERPAGLSLVGVSILVFLVPLAAAVIGAWWLADGPLGELLGALLGFGVGLLAVRPWAALGCAARKGPK